MPQDTAITPSSSSSRSLLNLIRNRRSSTLSLIDPEAEKLEKRRTINRRSQQKTRDSKEAWIKRLTEENGRLKERLETSPTISPSSETTYRNSASYTSSKSPGSSFHPSSSPTHSRYPSALRPGGISVDLVACREAFMAVLASVCDPHLNTIHAVCRRFSESRGLAPFGHSLHPPRPVDRPLNIYHQYSTPHLDTTSFNPYNFPTPPDFAQPTADLILFHNLFNTVTPPTAYIPAQGSEGPLSLPYLEPAHPVFGLEMDCADIWGCVLTVIDMSRTDAEALASSLTEKVRCYGFGPVIMKRDMMEVCEGFPQSVHSPDA